MAPRRSGRLNAGSTLAKPTKASSSSSVQANSAASQAALAAPRMAQPTDPDKVSFVDLPGEIRNQIYAELLPNVDLRALDWRAKFRDDGQKTSTRFMAACHQVYEEAVGMLYDDNFPTALNLRIYGSEDVSVLEHTIELSNAQPADFLILKRVKDISLDLHSFTIEECEENCNVQDGLFTVLRNLRGNHVLQSLSAYIEVGENEDAYHDSTPEPDSITWDGRKMSWNEKMMREFRKIKPDDISRPHVTAFLTDPFRTIRGLPDRKNAFRLKFTGETGRPWREISPQIRDMAQGSTPVPNYDIFTEYFDSLRQLKQIYLFQQTFPNDFAVHWLRSRAFREGADHEKAIQAIIEKLATARLRGDIKLFRATHTKLVDALNATVADKSIFGSAECYDQAEAREYWCRELTYLSEAMSHALPAEDTDTSFFGYNLANEGLRHWQTHGREEEKQAKNERKRKREEKKEAFNEAVKRVKTGDISQA